MNFEGKIKKDEKFGIWVAEIPALDVMAQGDSMEQAIAMIKDSVKELLLDMFQKKCNEIELVTEYASMDRFELRSSNSKLLISLALRRQREAAGLTIREVAKRLNVKSANGYAQYEHGKINISLNMLDKLLVILNPNSPRRIRIT